MNNLERIKEKLSALRDKTIANGCTEGEAMAAAAAAARIMERHGINASELEAMAGRAANDGGYGETRGQANGRSLHESVRYCGGTIGKVAGVLPMQGNGPMGKYIKFYGLESDRLYAEYLLSLIHIAMDSECARYLKSPARTGNARTARASFMVGMAGRITQRLEAMILENSDQKWSRARTEYQWANKCKLGRVGARKISARNGDAYHAGDAAAARVALNKSVGGRAGRIGAS